MREECREKKKIQFTYEFIYKIKTYTFSPKKYQYVRK